MGAAAVPLAMFGTSMGLQVYGGMQQAKALRAQGLAEQRYYNFLAGMNERDAADVMAAGDRQVTAIQDAGGRELGDLSRTVKQVEGAQKTAMAASGVPLDSVTAEDIARDTLNKKQMDEMVIRFNADSRAYETRLEAADRAGKLRTNAILNRLGGQNAYDASRLNARTSLLGTATSVASNWANFASTSMGRSPRAAGGGGYTYNPRLDVRGGY